MLYVLSYPALAASDAERIEKFRRIHEPERAGLVRAHITLVFGVRTIGVDDLSSRVESVAKGTAPFAVTFDRAEQAGVHNVFLLVDEGASTLESMHHLLYAGSLSRELLPNEPFRAHMTVATAASEDRVLRAMKDVSQIGLPIRGRIEKLEIVALGISMGHQHHDLRTGR